MEDFFLFLCAPKTNKIQFMNLKIAMAACMAALLLVACGPSAEEQAAAREKAAADSLAALASMEMSYTVDPAASKVVWAGTMLGIKTHTGSVNFLEGTLTTKGPTLVGGSFTVDMKNYALTDTNYAPDGADKGTRAMLMGHLTSPDFFNVDSFPTATLKITSVTGNKATADLTVRGKTHSENITDIVVTPNPDGSVTATAKLAFDRQKYGVAWSSGSKDAVLNDIIETNVEITAKAAK